MILDARTSVIEVDDDLLIDRLARRAWRGERELKLTKRQFDMLTVLALHPDWVVPRGQMARMVWRRELDSSNTIDRHVCTLRRLLNGPGEAPLIETVTNVGHRLRRVAR